MTESIVIDYWDYRQKAAGKEYFGKTFQHMGWRFGFDGAKRRMGLCNYDERVITVSKHFLVSAPDSIIIDTVNHELAHACVYEHYMDVNRVSLFGIEHHGEEWQSWAKALGCSPDACGNVAFADRPPPKWLLYCRTCGKTYEYYRRPKLDKACNRCYKEGQALRRLYRLEYYDGIEKDIHNLELPK